MLQSDDMIKKYIKQKKVIELAHKYLPEFIFSLYRKISSIFVEK